MGYGMMLAKDFTLIFNLSASVSGALHGVYLGGIG